MGNVNPEMGKAHSSELGNGLEKIRETSGTETRRIGIIENTSPNTLLNQSQGHKYTIHSTSMYFQKIETRSPQTLIEKERISEGGSRGKIEGGLSAAEKAEIRKARPDFPNKVIDAINSFKEYKIYDNAGLVNAEINGKPCLINKNIDYDQKDAWGQTNRERMEKGLAPLDKNGRPFELHHVGQKESSPLAELTFEEHRCNGNDIILHDKNKQTEVHGEGNTWDRERRDHWVSRAI